MPAGDGTGPRGTGPMTGRALGYCAGYAVPNYDKPAAGRKAGAAVPYQQSNGLPRGRSGRQPALRGGFGQGRRLGRGCWR